MKINQLILFLLLTFISCDSKDKLMANFVKCAINQIGKTYLEELNSRGPSVFSNSGLIWYCRDVAGFPKASTIYVSWKNVKVPKVGAYALGITRDTGVSVSGDDLGIIVSLNPTLVVVGDPEKGILTKQLLQFKKQYLRVEYIYVDF